MKKPNLIPLNLYNDKRGYFFESYNIDSYSKQNVSESFVQDNVSFSKHKGTIRGLHYQNPPMDQSKLIIVLQGSIMDVVVDIRNESQTYGQHHSVILTASEPQAFYIPSGFAHGFCTLEDDTLVLYKVNNGYSPRHDAGIRWDDPDLNIQWSLDGCSPTLSDKDLALPFFKDIVTPF